MNQRQAQLLHGLIDCYIATGQPIGSVTLIRYLGIDVSPATVRSALQQLDEEGYLGQPHTSAGRVPTDRGYRHYVDHSASARLRAEEERRIRQAFTRRYHEYRHRQRSAVKLLAELAHTVAVAVADQPYDVREAGMNELLKQLDRDELETAREVSTLLAVIEQYAAQLARQRVGTAVYIGAENPLLPARHTSLIVRTVSLPRRHTALIMVAGPKRMPYQRNRALVDYITELLYTQRS